MGILYLFFRDYRDLFHLGVFNIIIYYFQVKKILKLLTSTVWNYIVVSNLIKSCVNLLLLKHVFINIQNHLFYIFDFIIVM